MKPSLIAIIVLASSISAMTADVEIMPGIPLPVLTDRLATRGIEVSDRYQLAITPPRDKNLKSTFAPLDDDITVVIVYRKETQEVASLSLYFIPDNRTIRSQLVVREASSIKITDSGHLVFQISPKRSEPAHPAEPSQSSGR